MGKNTKLRQRQHWNSIAAVILFLVTTIVLISSCGDTVGPEFDIPFEDPTFEALIREVLDKPEGAITAEEMSSITELNGSQRGITNISGIEYCINLTDLSLEYNDITDFTQLSGLTNLRGLNLQSSHLNDIALLSGLTNLTGLNLTDNQFSDLTPLSGLTSLTNLAMSMNQITDFTPLSGLTNIGWLFLAGNQISDVTPLSGLTSLQVLTLNGNKISDIKPLVDNTGFGNGDFVELTTNPLSDTSINDYIPRLRAKGVDVRWEQN